jgi:hypothetical protein
MTTVCPYCRVRITEKTPNTVLVCAIPAHEECFKDHLKKHPPIHITIRHPYPKGHDDEKG